VGVVVLKDTPEGRMVCLTPNTSATHDFGSRADLPGAFAPKDATEAAKSWYVVTWTVPEQSMPLYIPTPSLAFSLRHGGFDQAGNLPFNPTAVHLTWPGQKEGVTIPSGTPALAFGGGVFTVPSGQFVYSANLAVGEYLEPSHANDASDGLLQYVASATGAVAVVERFDLTDMKLTFRTLQP
jgi:hypothetical protein